MRYIEHTVLIDVVNQMCEQMVGGHDLFETMILVQPRECKLQPEIMTSKKAVLECGAVAHNDVVFFSRISLAVACKHSLISTKSSS